MYWFKKIIRAILNLLPVFVLSLLFTNNTFALQHNFSGLFIGSNMACFDIQNNTLVRSSSCPDTSPGLFYHQSVFSLAIEGDAYNSSYSDLNFKYNDSRMLTTYNSSTNSCDYSSIVSLFSFNQDSSSISVNSNSTLPFYNVNDSNTPPCQKRAKFGSSNRPSFDSSSVPAGVMQCDRNSNGCLGGLTTVSDYVNSELSSYGYSYDGFYLLSSAIDTDSGMHYSNSLSLSDIFNTPIYTFSHLSIPLTSYDDFFLDSDNLYRGRQIEFKGVFEFDGSFAWHNNISSNGSHFRVNYRYLKKNSSTYNNTVDGYFDCTTNLITLSANNTTQLEFSCPFTFPEDAVAFNPTLSIDGNGNYVWITDHDWRFSVLSLITDNDTTPGYSFNSEIHGDGKIPGDASNLIGQSSNDIIIDGNNFSQSLIQLFGFTFLNPFAPLFEMFSNNDSCAQIPTLAGMIHSESTEVCPWFSSSVRNIVTPVLSIASMMLIFGFTVRWLGAKSGNFIEDSIQTEHYSFASKFRRNRNG